MGVVFRCSTKPESILQGANSAKVVVDGKAEVFDACLSYHPFACLQAFN